MRAPLNDRQNSDQVLIEPCGNGGNITPRKEVLVFGVPSAETDQWIDPVVAEIVEHGQLLETVKGSPGTAGLAEEIAEMLLAMDVLRIAGHYGLPGDFAERLESNGEEEVPDRAEVEAGWSSIDSVDFIRRRIILFVKLLAGDQRDIGAATVTALRYLGVASASQSK